MTDHVANLSDLLPAIEPEAREMSPSAIGQFIRFEQCHRFLRLDLYRSNKSIRRQAFATLGADEEQIAPLASETGDEFERSIVTALRIAGWTVYEIDDNTLERRKSLSSWLSNLKSGDSFIVYQPCLTGHLEGWSFGECRPDLVLLKQPETGPVIATIIDIKSAREVTLDHRIQVAIYALLVRELDPTIDTREAVLYRPPLEPRQAWSDQLLADQKSVESILRLTEAALLSPNHQPERVHDLVRRTILNPDSLANEIADIPFQDLPFHLTGKCDGCPHNQFCLSSARQSDDLSLIPYLSERNKRQIQSNGISTVTQLVDAAEQRPNAVQDLLAIPGLGPRLSEITTRADAYLKWQRGERVNQWLTDTTYSNLPSVSAAIHSNLIQIFLEVQRESSSGRFAALGALIACYHDGTESSIREASVVQISPTPIETDKQEAEFVRNWLRNLLRAVRSEMSLAMDGSVSAPVHFYVWDSVQIAALGDLANRHHQSVFGIEALMDLMMQRASFDSPSFSVIADEIEHQRALPMLCQSLQSVSRWLGYQWPTTVIDAFRTRQFDSLKVEEGGELSHLVPARSRFRSNIPGEYFQVAWGRGQDSSDDDVQRRGWQFYGKATIPLLSEYLEHRLRAVKHVTGTLRTNRHNVKSNFNLSVLDRLKIRPETPIEAIREFIAIERHIEFDDWRTTRSLSPERRVLTGDSLLARYRDEDQPLDVRIRVREARTRNASRGQLSDEEFAGLSTSEKKELTWSLNGATISLAIEEDDLPIGRETVLLNARIRTGDHVIVGSAVVGQAESGDDAIRSTSAKALLYQFRGIVKEISPSGRVDVELRETHGRPGGFVFSSFLGEPPIDGALIAIEPNPDSWPSFRQWNVANEIASGAVHGGYKLIWARDGVHSSTSAVAADAQRRFADGLSRFVELDMNASRYEPSKLDYIGDHGAAPVILVQGPPGTGKSTTTGFAVLARLQAAIASGEDLRIAVACKTHAATDVLLNAIRRAQRRLQEISAQNPDFFEMWFDSRILEVPLYRFEPKDRNTASTDIKFFEATSTMAQLNEATRWPQVVVAGTTNALGKLANNAWQDGQPPWDLLILDEASQMSIPEYLVASIGLKPGGQLIVVGDHRQMPPVVRRNWEDGNSLNIDPHAAYRSLFDVIRTVKDHIDIQFEESFRIHRDVATYLREEIYVHDRLDLKSFREQVLVESGTGALESAILSSPSPVVLVVHGERQSQQRNELEREITARLVVALNALEDVPSIGVVVPHRAQRADLQARLLALTGSEAISQSVDTIERFQGNERDVIIVSATESDPAYLRDTASFLLDPRRLTVALSRAEQKLIVIASQSIFDYLPTDEKMLADSELWRHLRDVFCTIPVWDGEVSGHQVNIFGSRELARTEAKNGKSDDGR